MNIVRKVVRKHGIANSKLNKLCKKKDRELCTYLCISSDYPQYKTIEDALSVIISKRPCRRIWK